MDTTPIPEEVMDADSVVSDVKPSVTTVVPVLPVAEGTSSETSTSANVVVVAEPVVVAQTGEALPAEANNENDNASEQNILSEIVSLRHAKQNIEEELLDVKEKCKELSTRNSELQSQVASSTENFGLKDELQKVLHEKAALLQEKNSREQEMRTIMSERERAHAETEVYANSRSWFLQEIAQRDNKCAEIKIEMEADEARRRLESARDATTRELAFTRAELEKYQRDHAKVSKQVQHLLFVMEKERRGEDEAMEDNEEENARLFNNIAQLQKINRRLESELEVAKTSAEQVVLTSKNAEIECLKRELESTRKAESSLKGELEQMHTTFDLLQAQTEQLKKLTEDNVSVAEARTAKIKAEEAAAKAQASELKVARLEEYIRALKEEREISERVHSDRAARNEQVVAEVKMTNARLEASFELQKQTTAVFEKELERAQKEFDQIREENDRLRSADAQMAGKVEQLQNELFDMQRKANNY
ncbi:hypothetical protein ANCCEY_14708, partial [Ancylostoma ceylanicum]